jgi:hypothetical protein
MADGETTQCIVVGEVIKFILGPYTTHKSLRRHLHHDDIVIINETGLNMEKI